MKVLRRVLPLLILPALVLAGCGENQEVAEQRARLDLAEIKGDLDEIYLSLNRLAKAGENGAETRLQEITTAISLREQMNLTVDRHNHEAALLLAARIVDLVPNNKEAKAILRDSGQLLFLLQMAQDKVAMTELGVNGIATSPEKVSLEKSLSESEQQSILTQLVQELLLQLDYAIGTPDGVAGPKTVSAIQSFQKEQGLENNGVVSVELANRLYDRLAADKENRQRRAALVSDAEKLSLALDEARNYLEKAIELDPQFENSLDLERRMAQTQAALIGILAEKTLGAGQSLVSNASHAYRAASKKLSVAVSAGYESVVNAWTSVDKRLKSTREALKPQLVELDRCGKLLAAETDGDTKILSDAALAYIATVKKTVEVLLIPQGGYLVYRTAANNAISKHESAINRLQRMLPAATMAHGSLVSALEPVTGYAVYESAETRKIIEENAELYRLY